MKLFRLELKILSPPSTPWQSDTLFGHICWQVVQREGEVALKDFLEPFLRGEPPLVLSDGFPHHCIPIPLPPPSVEEYPNLEDYRRKKQAKKLKYCFRDDFWALREGKINLLDLIEKYEPLKKSPGLKTEEILHTAIDRNTGTALEGQLYTTEVYYFECGEQDEIVDIYLLCLPEWEKRAVGLIEMVAETGYGKDKSSGCGHFELAGYFDADDLLQLPHPTAFMTLSSYVPAETDPAPGRWKLRTKYGKLSEGAGNGHPFKRALLQIEPGAVFYSDNPRPYYGTMVKGIAGGMPEAVQCGFTITLPLRC